MLGRKTPMNGLDIAFLVLCGLMTLWGASNGIIGMVFNLVVAVVAVLVGSRLGPKVGEILIPSSGLGDVQTFFGFMLTYLVIFIVVSAVAASWARRVLNVVPFFGWFNMLGGAAVGLLVGALLSFGVVVGTKQLNHEFADEFIAESRFGSFVIENLGFVAQAIRLVPEDWKVEMEDRIGRATDPWDRLI